MPLGFADERSSPRARAATFGLDRDGVASRCLQKCRQRVGEDPGVRCRSEMNLRITATTLPTKWDWFGLVHVEIAL